MSSGHCPRPGYLLCLNNASTRMHLSLFPIHYLYTGRYKIVSISSETCVMKLSLIFAIPKLGCTIYNSFHMNFPQGCFPPFTCQWCSSLQCWWGPWSVQASRTSKLLPRTSVVRTLFFHIILAHKRCSHQVFCSSNISNTFQLILQLEKIFSPPCPWLQKFYILHSPPFLLNYHWEGPDWNYFTWLDLLFCKIPKHLHSSKSIFRPRFSWGKQILIYFCLCTKKSKLHAGWLQAEDTYPNLIGSESPKIECLGPLILFPIYICIHPNLIGPDSPKKNWMSGHLGTWPECLICHEHSVTSLRFTNRGLWTCTLFGKATAFVWHFWEDDLKILNSPWKIRWANFSTN